MKKSELVLEFATFFCGFVAVSTGSLYIPLAFALSAFLIYLAITLLLIGTLCIVSSALAVFATWKHEASMPSRGEKRASFIFVGFILVGYLIPASMQLLLPATTHVPALLLFSVCPAAMAAATVDLSSSTVFLVLAPWNAMIFGALGGIISCNMIRRLRG